MTHAQEHCSVEVESCPVAGADGIVEALAPARSANFGQSGRVTIPESGDAQDTLLSLLRRLSPQLQNTSDGGHSNSTDGPLRC